MNIIEAKDLIDAKYDVVEVIDILGIDTKDILDRFEDILVEVIDDFEEINEAFEFYED